MLGAAGCRMTLLRITKCFLAAENAIAWEFSLGGLGLGVLVALPSAFVPDDVRGVVARDRGWIMAARAQPDRRRAEKRRSRRGPCGYVDTSRSDHRLQFFDGQQSLRSAQASRKPKPTRSGPNWCVPTCCRRRMPKTSASC